MGRARGWGGPIVAGAVALAASAAFAGAGPAPRGTLADDRHHLLIARAAAASASAHAAETGRAAEAERDAARRVQARRAVVAAQVGVAQADLAAARARVALADRLLDDRRRALAAGEAPVARLLGALASLARRPASAMIAQPGSIDDLVHLRAVLGSAVPAIRARTQGVRAELAATRRLERDAGLAAAALVRSRTMLDRRRIALAALAARHGGRAAALGRTALAQGDRAIALGEEARDIVDRISDAGDRRTTLAELETLPGPATPAARPDAGAHGTYRLPVAGRLATGFGELSAAGVRSRGLTLAVTPRAAVVAPAGGQVAYAGAFRGYGGIVILDHGAGWTSLVAGLAVVAVRAGDRVAAGAPIGIAGGGDAPHVTVELRRRGRPVDLTALL